MLHNSAGRTLKALKLRGANLQYFFAPLKFGAFEVCPRNNGAFEVPLAEFWSNATCAFLFHGDIVMDAKIFIKII